MKKIFITALFFTIFSFPSFLLLAQDADNIDWKSMTRKERKEMKKKLAAAENEKIMGILESQEWVIEAHTVYDRYSQSYQINPSINFVGVIKEKGAMQLGFDGLVGWNGVGGVTIDGSVFDYKIKKGKGNKSHGVTLRFRGKGTGSASVVVTINSSYQANAQVNGDFGDRFSFSGKFVPLSQSTVYKGQSLF